MPSYSPNPSAKARLFCFPYAGGSASFYRNWTVSLPRIDVLPIQLPGREERLFDRPFLHVDELVSSLAPHILPLLDRPFSFMGYSMGGMIAYELAYYLQDLMGLSPEYLFVGACRAPKSSGWLSLQRSYSDMDIIHKLRRLGGTPEEILCQPEYLEILLPTLRADFMLCSNYKPRETSTKLNSSILVLGGKQDQSVSIEDLEQWETETNREFEYKQYEGGHFFINDHLLDIQYSIYSSMTTTVRSSKGEKW